MKRIFPKICVVALFLFALPAISFIIWRVNQSRAVAREADVLAHIRAAQVALAFERFRLANGRLPERLGELAPQFIAAVPIDPFDGAPLRYRRLAKGYVVYSVGEDGHDDGGREKPTTWKSTDKTSYDITFTVER